MNWFNNINISISYNPILLIVGILVIVLYTLFIYKTTLPIISKFWKSLLIFIRITALTLILLLIFEPILRISTENKIEPTNIIFIDNSISISEFSPPDQINNLENFVQKLDSKLDGNKQIFTYGSNLNPFEPAKDSLRFNENSTEFNSAIKLIKSTKDIASIVLIGDGILNQSIGIDQELKNLRYPIFTIGIGDTSENYDLIADKIISNEYIYTDRETEIEILLKNINLANTNASIEIYDNDSFLLSKNIQLSKTGINRIRFPYLSKEEGQRKLTLKAKSNENEKNIYNNITSSLINVLSTKKKIALISGSPSSDLSFISNSIKQNEEFELTQIIEINSNSFYKNKFDLKYLENADVVFLVGFPNSNTSNKFINDVVQILKKTSSPLFMAFSSTIDLSKINTLESIIPFKIDKASPKFMEVQISATNNNSGLLGNSQNIIGELKNLPPVNLSISSIIPSFNSEVLLSSNSNNKPILFRNSNNDRKSIVLTAANFWRWKLNARKDDLFLFDNLILNSIKWLGIDAKNDFLSVSLNKLNYNLGESIGFIANLYDDAYEPVENEQINLKILKADEVKEYSFKSIGNGIYEANININEHGLFNYEIELKNNSRNLKPKTGTFNIEPINVELIENKLNDQFLQSISKSTGGIYTSINNSGDIINELNNNFNNKIYYNNTDKELRLSSFELILLSIVLLFSIEWIIRKILRMI